MQNQPLIVNPPETVEYSSTFVYVALGISLAMMLVAVYIKRRRKTS